jgi:hypothetical protein
VEESGRDQITDIYESGVSGVCIMLRSSALLGYSAPDRCYSYIITFRFSYNGPFVSCACFVCSA